MKIKFVCMLLSAAVMTACSPQAPPAPPAPEPAATAPQVAECAPNITATPAAAPAHGATFTVTLPSPPPADVTYFWSITAGAITSGQGSPSIVVEAPAGEELVVTVDVGGLAAECQRIGSTVLQIP